MKSMLNQMNKNSRQSIINNFEDFDIIILNFKNYKLSWLNFYQFYDADICNLTKPIRSIDRNLLNCHFFMLDY